MPVVTSGIDVQLADLLGSNYAYRGWFAYLESEMPLPRAFSLTTQLGGGYRNYPDFVGDPSRNETLWRASVELSKDLTTQCRLTAFSTYDRFGSPNELYDTSRYLTGITTTFRW